VKVQGHLERTLSFASTFAPACSSARTHSAWPLSAAAKIGLSPFCAHNRRQMQRRVLQIVGPHRASVIHVRARTQSTSQVVEVAFASSLIQLRSRPHARCALEKGDFTPFTPAHLSARIHQTKTHSTNTIQPSRVFLPFHPLRTKLYNGGAGCGAWSNCVGNFGFAELLLGRHLPAHTHAGKSLRMTLRVRKQDRARACRLRFTFPFQSSFIASAALKRSACTGRRRQQGDSRRA
jgi:hypothetical protein